MRIVERLSDGEAKQKELVAELGLSSGTASRWLTELAQANLVVQDSGNSHDAYRLVEPQLTNELLDLAALLASQLSGADLERAKRQAEVDDARLVERRRR